MYRLIDPLTLTETYIYPLLATPFPGVLYHRSVCNATCRWWFTHLELKCAVHFLFFHVSLVFYS